MHWNKFLLHWNETLSTISYHFPSDREAKLEKGLRKESSILYGYITFGVLLTFLIALPIYGEFYRRYLFNVVSRVAHKVAIAQLRNNYVTVNFPVIKTILAWSIILGLLSVSQTHGDLLFLAARLGRVATYCLPTLLFITLRPSPLPKVLYLSLLPMHKWVSRMVVLQSAIHTALYLVYFHEKNAMFKAVKRDNFYGIIAMAAFVIIALTSLPKVRRLSYRIFYVNHYICTWVVVIALHFHARPGIPGITLLNICILLTQACYRLKNTRKCQLNIVPVSPDLILVLIPNSAISIKSALPGCHIRLIDNGSTVVSNKWKRFIMPLQHPYTLASLPGDEYQKLIVRRGQFKFDKCKKYLVTGSYLPHLNFMRSKRRGNARSLLFNVKCKRCLIVVGGSAISFALPILRVLNYNGCEVKIIWVIRDYQDIRILNHFQNTLIEKDCIEIFITGKYDDDEKAHFMDALDKIDRERRHRETQEQEIIFTDHVDIPDSPHEPKSLQRNPDVDMESGNITPPPSSKASRASLASLMSANTFNSLFENEDNLENVDLDLSRKCDRPPNPSDPGATGVSAGVDAGNASEATPLVIKPKRQNYTFTNSIYNQVSQISVLNSLGCHVSFGRPLLGIEYYNWCVNTTCVGPLIDVKSGQSVCCQRALWERESGLIKPNGSRPTASDQRVVKDLLIKTRKARGGRITDDVWVVGAGPIGLVDNVRLWAKDCGFHFHAESFSV